VTEKVMAVAVIEQVDRLRTRLATARRDRTTIGLVPTMGALHAGHVELIRHARRTNDLVVVSIFVNPLQFDRQDDLDRYPRTLDTDVATCQSAGVAVVFAPSAAEMYPAPPLTTLSVGRIVDRLCGPFRPGHFAGVATVVMKLLQIVQPDAAYFGEKDAQQLAVVRRMVADLNVPVRIVPVPTVRERDGLALSSRNARLSPEERPLAIALYRALQALQAVVGAGETDSAAALEQATATIPRDDRLRLEYLEIVDEHDFQPVERISVPVIAAGALWVGDTRLIDNVRLMPPGRS
jgi:pantoate--beta-alanine ligase